MSQRAIPWNEREIRAIRAGLLGFFEDRRRPLPWRAGDPDPWGVLVCEVMSQQTRIETVVPYYLRWMERFPDPGALAGAAEEEVLALWEGLGYYSRARHLHRAAREIETRYGGRVPADPDELRTLPGVGPYTAGAVASIAYGVAAAAVDGNVRRVLARLLDEPRPSPARLAEWAGALVDPERPGDCNQALMELGATVCTPRSPTCGGCPLEAFCGARAAGTVEERPAPRPRSAVPQLDEGVLVLMRGEGGTRELLMRRRPRTGLLAGMWEFPGAEPRDGESPAEAARRAGRPLGYAALESLDEAVRPEGSGRAADRGGRSGAGDPSTAWSLPTVRHVFSHRVVSYHPFLVALEDGASREAPPSSARWVGPREIERLPIPVAQRAILGEVERCFPFQGPPATRE